MDTYKTKEKIRKKISELPKPLYIPVNFIYEQYSKYSPHVRWLPRNIFSTLMFWFKKDEVIENLNLFEKKIYSQNGEDGIIKAIFKKIGTTNRYCVEFGVEDGKECNTRYLIEKYGWGFLQMDNQKNLPKTIKKEFVTADNIEALFKKYEVPKEFDLLSIDVDSHDYWIWKALENYSPRVVIIEYNSGIPPDQPKVIKPQIEILEKFPDITKGGGAGILALKKLGNRKGYNLVACDSRGINAFFIRNDLVEGNFIIKDLKEIYYPPKTGPKVNGHFSGFPPDEQAVIEV